MRRVSPNPRTSEEVGKRTTGIQAHPPELVNRTRQVVLFIYVIIAVQPFRALRREVRHDEPRRDMELPARQRELARIATRTKTKQ